MSFTIRRSLFLAARRLCVAALPVFSLACTEPAPCPEREDCDNDGRLPADFCNSRAEADEDAVNCLLTVNQGPLVDGGVRKTDVFLSRRLDGGADLDWYLAPLPPTINAKSLLHVVAGYQTPQTGVNLSLNLLTSDAAGDLTSIASGVDQPGAAAPKPVELLLPFSTPSAKLYVVVGDEAADSKASVDRRSPYTVMVHVQDNPDSNEPNDTAAAASAIAMASADGGLQGTNSGYLATQDDVDQYSIDVAGAGLRLISLHITGPNPHPTNPPPPYRLSYTLFNPAGTSVAEGHMDNELLAIDLATSRAVTEATNGTWRLEVKGFKQENSTEKIGGDLNLKYDVVVRVLPEADSTDANDRLAINGRVCTAPPDRTGFPVKVVLIVDQSGSMCVSDPPGSQESSGFCEAHAYVPPGVTQPGRVLALNRLLEQFQSQPNVQVALVPFETNVQGVWPTAGAGGQHFARPDSTLRVRVNTLQAELGQATDYQGALATAYSIVASDISATGQANPELLPRTKYVVVFLTDGTPFPRCAAEDNLTEYADDLHPGLLWADSLGAGGDGPGNYCNRVEPDDPDAITGFVKGTDRNQNYQLYSYVNQLMELKKSHNIGDIRLNTVLLFNQEAVRACGAICQDVYGEYVRYPGQVPVADGPAAARRIAQYLLKEMADLGNGVYQEYNDFGGIGALDLGSLNYSALVSRNVMKTLLVQPLSSEPGPLDPSDSSQAIARVVDSDGDALPDVLDNDFAHATNPFLADSDEDGFDDTFEVSRASDGFRPHEKDGRGCDPASPLTPSCRPRDTDGDGLPQYAETYLHTRSTLVDSDGDGIPDGMEVRYGLDPLSPLVASLDTDGDGAPDAEELRLGSNPIRRDREYLSKHGFQYTVVAETQPDESICYDFSVSNVQLVTPPNQAGLRQGFNLFKVWFGEAPENGVATDYGVWKAGCVWAQYDPPSIRVPAGPADAPLTNASFVAPSRVADRSGYEVHCVGVSPSQVP